MLEVFDRQRNLIGILENAYGLSEELKINSVNYFKFSLPFNDFKNELCQPFHYIRYKKGQLYRILPSQITVNELGDIQYSCEHVLALLIDKVMFGEHVLGNKGFYTKDVIEYVLKHQIEKNWVLGECDFNHEYEYGWTSETLLSALFSITTPFVEKFMWTFDTNVYPFRLGLKKIDENKNAEIYIRMKKNMLQLVKTSDPTNICTRIYPLGEGEGINQVNVKNLTGGVPYVQCSKDYIDKYGVVERIWIDRRYTDEVSLYNAAIAMLNELKDPLEEYQVDFAKLGEDYYDTPALGKVVEIVDYKKTYITAITFNYDEIETSKISIANKPTDMSSTVADMQDRQRIEMTYSQGATQFYQDHVYDNATPTVGLPLKLMLPSSMKIVNKINIDVEVGPFRKPFSQTEDGGEFTVSNTSGSGQPSIKSTSDYAKHNSQGSSLGETVVTGDTNITIENNNGGTLGDATEGTTGEPNVIIDTEDTENRKYTVNWTTCDPEDYNGNLAIGYAYDWDGENISDHSHAFNPIHSHEIIQHNHSLAHTHELSTHGHNFTLEGHSHNVQHTHEVLEHRHEIPHTHSLSHTHTVGNHRHNLEPDIFFQGNPSGFDLLINGVKVETVSGNSLQKDITQFLVGNENRIPRDIYHKIEIVPNDTAYVMLTVSIQGFIQSRGDMTV